jgi:hypothetical protein
MVAAPPVAAAATANLFFGKPNPHMIPFKGGGFNRAIKQALQEVDQLPWISAWECATRNFNGIARLNG